MGVIVQKSYAFALSTVKLCHEIMRERKEYILTKQLIRSATSIGANVEEATGAQTRKDFIAKMYIAYKEAREAHYWFRLLNDLNLLTADQAQYHLAVAEEVKKILMSICKSSKENQ
ncbi:four helix bundle protein [Algivirga pacifica]|uniref:Four helix bundle protein n=1 Tax=Algivirga pacifica TaxID=1162670 RepID=A0ABP9D5L1_9BACT